MRYSSQQQQPLNVTDSSPYVIAPMDSGQMFGKKEDDDDEVGLGFQNTLVSFHILCV